MNITKLLGSNDMVRLVFHRDGEFVFRSIGLVVFL